MIIPAVPRAANKIPLLTIAIAAYTALAAERFITPSGQLPAPGANSLGVTATSAAVTGDLVPVDVLGTTIVVAGAAIANGAAVEVGDDGKAITQAAGVAVGRALQAATADGDRIEVMLIPN